jgi:hypothetical protein
MISENIGRVCCKAGENVLVKQKEDAFTASLQIKKRSYNRLEKEAVPLYLRSVFPKFHSQCLRLAVRQLVEQRPKTLPMIHLASMRQFV